MCGPYWEELCGALKELVDELVTNTEESKQVKNKGTINPGV